MLPVLDYTCTGVGSFRYKDSCKLFFHCINNTKDNTIKPSPYLLECQGCMQFNQLKQRCDFPENVGECMRPRRSHKHQDCTAPGNYTIPFMRTCRQYYRCAPTTKDRELVLHINSCPSGHVYSRAERRCVEGLKCPRPVVIEGRDKCRPGQNCITGDHYDCRKFYQCRAGNVIIFYCPEPYVYDKAVCRLRGQVECGANFALADIGPD